MALLGAARLLPPRRLRRRRGRARLGESCTAGLAVESAVALGRTASVLSFAGALSRGAACGGATLPPAGVESCSATVDVGGVVDAAPAVAAPGRWPRYQ